MQIGQIASNSTLLDDGIPCSGFVADVRSLRGARQLCQHRGDTYLVLSIPKLSLTQLGPDFPGLYPLLSSIRENSESHLSLLRRLNEEMAYTESQVGPAGCYIREAGLPSSYCEVACLAGIRNSSAFSTLHPSLTHRCWNQMLAKGFANQKISQSGVYPPSTSFVLLPML